MMFFDSRDHTDCEKQTFSLFYLFIALDFITLTAICSLSTFCRWAPVLSLAAYYLCRLELTFYLFLYWHLISEDDWKDSGLYKCMTKDFSKASFKERQQLDMA